MDSNPGSSFGKTLLKLETTEISVSTLVEGQEPRTDGENPLKKFPTLRVLNMNLLVLPWIFASNASSQSIFAIIQGFTIWHEIVPT